MLLLLQATIQLPYMVEKLKIRDSMHTFSLGGWNKKGALEILLHFYMATHVPFEVNQLNLFEYDFWTETMSKKLYLFLLI